MKKMQSNVPKTKTNCENLINIQIAVAVIKKYQKAVDFFFSTAHRFYTKKQPKVFVVKNPIQIRIFVCDTFTYLGREVCEMWGRGFVCSGKFVRCGSLTCDTLIRGMGDVGSCNL